VLALYIITYADILPVFFAGNRYVHSMYLALLAGGQIIKRIVKKTLHLPGDEGLEIFQFKGIERKELREQIKATIDSLQLSRTTKDAVVAENIRCFRMNIQLVKGINIKWSNYQRLGIVAAAVMIVLVIAFLYWRAVFS